MENHITDNFFFYYPITKEIVLFFKPFNLLLLIYLFLITYDIHFTSILLKSIILGPKCILVNKLDMSSEGRLDYLLNSDVLI